MSPSPLSGALPTLRIACRCDIFDLSTSVIVLNKHFRGYKLLSECASRAETALQRGITVTKTAIFDSPVPLFDSLNCDRRKFAPSLCTGATEATGVSVRNRVCGVQYTHIKGKCDRDTGQAHQTMVEEQEVRPTGALALQLPRPIKCRPALNAWSTRGKSHRRAVVGGSRFASHAVH